MQLAEHPTVKRHRQQEDQAVVRPGTLDAAWLRQVVLDAGADDVGFVEIERQAVDDQRDDILQALPSTQTLISYVRGLPLVFQPHKSAGLDATYHFSFTGSDQGQLTVVIRDKQLSVKQGLVGTADLRVTADSEVWLGFLAHEKSPSGRYCGARSACKARHAC